VPLQKANALWDLFAIELDGPLCIVTLEGEKQGLMVLSTACPLHNSSPMHNEQ
jgi:hypothetical protein